LNLDDTAALETEVRKLIQLTIEKNIDALNLDDNVLQKMGLDSMSALEIMAAIEQRFKIRIQEQDLPKITTLRSVLDLIEKHIKKKK